MTTFKASLNIKLNSYCTRHLAPCYELHHVKPCVVNIMVGNKEMLQSTHSGSLRLGNIVINDRIKYCFYIIQTYIFEDVLFVPGLLLTLISSP